ncbi:MAG: tRNA uridine(34) 5-carboxymethylaminomethyl modification radical SAM/GNAT enzyme Elp3 [Thermoanaerobaculia bacterium]
MPPASYNFRPQGYESDLVPIVEEIRAAGDIDADALQRIVRKYPKDGRGAFSKSEIISGFRHFAPLYGWRSETEFLDRIRMKPVRTASGVAPVTVLTQPFPCPGKCIFCPSDVRMPKSYLSREPGAQRAAQHEFDPYLQTLSRIQAFYNNGHRVDKVELIILGGTWSFYPEAFQIWFVKRCFEAMNGFAGGERRIEAAEPQRFSFRDFADEVDGLNLDRSYNQVISSLLVSRQAAGSGANRLIDDACAASWQELEEVQAGNEGAAARCVGLVVETRPDHLDADEVVRIRRLGATKVQIGVQSLSDEVLRRNRRGHDVAATRRAFRLLRQGGFKIHAHWMPNLYGSDPDRDVEDFERLFADPALRPDELKIYPCSLIESAELMQYYRDGRWRPYDREELMTVLSECLLRVPAYCRLTRMIRDIPGDDIHAGNRTTNFREVVEKDLARRGRRSVDIRAREIRGAAVDPGELILDRIDYRGSAGCEVFLQFVTPENRIVGFCRLRLPDAEGPFPEIGASAMIREVHVYGLLVGIGDRESGRPQHLGLGRRLIAEAARLAAAGGFRDLAVISSVGTREYYRRLGFVDGELYQHRPLSPEETMSPEETLCAE